MINNATTELETIEIDLLLEAIFRKYGYDFRSYARPSVKRRIKQFLSSTGCTRISELIPLVLNDEEFFSRLVQYFSISVTEMFRDPFVYRSIRENIVPILKTWPHVKIWCAGCATGEEVYSLIIVLDEEGLANRAHIYATDFNDNSLAKAAEGIYSIESIKNATENFHASGGRDSFAKYYHSYYNKAVMDSSLKDRITFANHNLVSDNVFGEMQLVFCRNVLIYFNRELKNRVLGIFSASLVYGGYLCLGTKEDIRFSSVFDAYVPVDVDAKIYKKVE